MLLNSNCESNITLRCLYKLSMYVYLIEASELGVNVLFGCTYMNDKSSKLDKWKWSKNITTID